VYNNESSTNDGRSHSSFKAKDTKGPEGTGPCQQADMIIASSVEYFQVTGKSSEDE